MKNFYNTRLDTQAVTPMKIGAQSNLIRRKQPFYTRLDTGFRRYDGNITSVTPTKVGAQSNRIPHEQPSNTRLDTGFRRYDGNVLNGNF
jgi:hypothetical protein